MRARGGDAPSSAGNLNAKRSFLGLPYWTFPHSVPLGSFLLMNMFLIPLGQHILFKGTDEDILIKFSDESNLPEKANKINDKIISTIEFNKMTFKKE